MANNYQKEWNYGDVYNFSIEFNRIESYNLYIEQWLKEYYGYSFTSLEHKTNWTISDIVDYKDFSRVSQNVGILFEHLSNIADKRPIRPNAKPINRVQNNKVFNEMEANKIETYLNENNKKIGNMQFATKITGLAICGNENRLMGVE